MKLAFIEMSGFRGVKQTLKMSVGDGFLIVVGPNGSGKSTICDAIEFGLTGDIRKNGFKEKGESISDYLWWRGQNATSDRFVKLVFRDSAGKDHEITRFASGETKDPSAVLGRLIDKDACSLGPSDLCVTSIIRDEEITSLSVDLPEGERYRLVCDALGTVSLADVEERLHNLTKVVQTRRDAQDAVYQRYRAQLTDIVERLSESRSSHERPTENAERELREVLSSESTDLTELQRLATSHRSAFRREIDRLHQLLVTIDQCISEAGRLKGTAGEAELSALGNDLDAVSVTLGEEQVRLRESERHLNELRSVEKSNTLLAELLATGERIGVDPGEVCPLCGSHVVAGTMAANIKDKRRLIDADADAVVAASEECRSLRSAVEQLVFRKAEVERARESLVRRRKQIDEGIKKVRSELSDIGLVSDGDLEQCQAVTRNAIENIRVRLSRLERATLWLESSQSTTIIQKMEAEQKITERRSAEAYEILSKADASLEKCKRATKEIKRLVGEAIDEQLSELSPLITEIYKRLRPHVEWNSVGYHVRGDVRRMLRFEVGEGINPSFVFSSGQRRTLGIAFLLSLHLSRRWCLWQSLVLDDPIQHIDDFRALNLSEVLSAIRRTGRQIICCVEDMALADLLCRRLRSDSSASGSIAHMEFDKKDGIRVRQFKEIRPLSQHVLVGA
jgi:chromosome segregation protein